MSARKIEIKDGTVLPVRGLRWDDGWEFGCPVVLIEPVVRVKENGCSFEHIIDTLGIDGCIDGKLCDRGDSATWRWGKTKAEALKYLRRKFYRTTTQRITGEIQFFRDESDPDEDELTFEFREVQR